MFPFFKILMISITIFISQRTISQVVETSVSGTPGIFSLDTPDEIKNYHTTLSYYKAAGFKTVAFLGFSNAGYQDESILQKVVKAYLTKWEKKHENQNLIIKIGGTAVGIGKIYEILKKEVETTSTEKHPWNILFIGVLSTRAKGDDGQVQGVSKFVDKVFLINNNQWGGWLETDSTKSILSPTSQFMVNNNDLLIAIGGGGVAAAELEYTIKRNKTYKWPNRYKRTDVHYYEALNGKGEPGAALEIAKKYGVISAL